MSDWINAFDHQQKRKRITELKRLPEWRRALPSISRVRDRDLLPRGRKRLRTLSSGVISKTLRKSAIIDTTATENEKMDQMNDDSFKQKDLSALSSPLRENNPTQLRKVSDDLKIPIDDHTFKGIKLEVERMLPTTLYDMGRSLATSGSVLFLHSQNKHFQKTSFKHKFFFSLDRIYRRQHSKHKATAIRNRRRSQGSKQSRWKSATKNDAPMQLLAPVYSQLGVFHEEDQDDFDDDDNYSNDTITTTTSSPESMLKNTLEIFAKQPGSLQKTIMNWESAQTNLETILLFPSKKDENNNPEKKHEAITHSNSLNTPSSSKQGKSRSWKKYLKNIIHETTKRGQTWKQIQIPDNFVQPLEEELSKINLDLQHAKSQRKDALLSTTIQTQMEKKEQERLEKEQKLQQAAEEAAKNILRPLTDEEKEIVHYSMYGPGPGNQIITSSATESVQRDSIRKLRPQTWLNDEIIHYFLLMLTKRDEEFFNSNIKSKRSHFFKSFFITKLLDECGYKYSNVKRWSKRVPGKDIFNLDKIIFPVNISGMHWSLIVIFMQQHKIQFFDSMGGSGQRYLDGLLQYLKDEHIDKKKRPMEGVDDWKLVICQPDTPQQENGFDCGVFTCMFADFISQDMPLNFSQEHINECRERIALSIMNGKAIV